MEKLANHVATKHEYTDQSKSLCAPGTRVKIQTDILEWLSSQTSSSEHIFWITGIAGSGKSTLSATVADTLRTMGTPVAAQFFISRNIPETTDPDKMIPTIAKQLSEFSPAAARVIQDALKHGFISPRTEQVQKLLLAPIREICKSHDRVIILIDALDELEKADESVLQILSPIAASDLPDNIRFLITSRPERWADIRSQTLELAVFKEHSLLTDSSVQEVHNFIVAKMQEITPKKQGWDSWPTQDQLSELSRTADGLFHYATTALQWIKEQISNDGVSCQTWVFQKFTALGIGQLENLYKLILTSFEDTDHVGKDAARRGHRLRGFQHIIGTIIVLYKPLTIYQIIDLLADIPKTEFDVDNFLEQFCSVLIPGMTTSFMEATPQMHKSFRDYITGAHAPEEFCIPVGHAHFVTARSCLEVIVKAGSSSDAVVQYSVAYWCQHLRKAVEGQVDFGDEGGIWNLFERMTEEAVVSVWKPNAWDIFRDVATAGWKLLQKGTDKHRMEGISAIVVKAKVKCVLFLRRPSLPCSLSLAFSSLAGACFSSVARPCLAHCPSPSHL
ncbi:hypothetical protein B0H16DRAFT_238453 [Mycena metata]|uniref:NACHT domain-containing protein n=1 Tax=Mycena metata TaxID=1033252 RepID=A0AAD7NQC8_9AGAR|nr:hypothetical protein B0H16DRAFT_238453 [Mycena metata]